MAVALTTPRQVFERLTEIAEERDILPKEAVPILRKELQEDAEKLMVFWVNNGEAVIWHMIQPHLTYNRGLSPAVGGRAEFATVEPEQPEEGFYTEFHDGNGVPAPASIDTKPRAPAPRVGTSWRKKTASAWDHVVPTYRGNGESKRAGDLNVRDIEGIWGYYFKLADTHTRKAGQWKAVKDSMGPADTLSEAYDRLPETAKTFIATEVLGTTKADLRSERVDDPATRIFREERAKRPAAMARR